jgi:hypothetical protein
MAWVVLLHPEFEPEFGAMSVDVQDALLEAAKVLEAIGPTLGRPSVDTLKGSRFANMKELRFNVDRGFWRVAFAFDPRRRAILLVAGNKGGLSRRMQVKFYRDLIAHADARFARFAWNGS